MEIEVAKAKHERKQSESASRYQEALGMRNRNLMLRLDCFVGAVYGLSEEPPVVQPPVEGTIQEIPPPSAEFACIYMDAKLTQSFESATPSVSAPSQQSTGSVGGELPENVSGGGAGKKKKVAQGSMEDQALESLQVRFLSL